MPWKLEQRLTHVGPPDESIAKIRLKDGRRKYTVVCIGTFDHPPASYLAIHPDFVPKELAPLVNAEWTRRIEAHEAHLQMAFEEGALTSDQYKGTTPEERALRAGYSKNSMRIAVDDPRIGDQLCVWMDRESYLFPGVIVGLKGSA